MFGRLFASLFGALAIAGAFAYYNYKFSQYKFIDFTEFVGYTDQNVFEPMSDKYLVLIYNSRDLKTKEILQDINLLKTDQVLAIDYFQSTSSILKIGEANVSAVKFGADTFLKITNIFNINFLPVMFSIEKSQGKKYKQTGEIYIFEKFKQDKL